MLGNIFIFLTLIGVLFEAIGFVGWIIELKKEKKKNTFIYFFAYGFAIHCIALIFGLLE